MPDDGWIEWHGGECPVPKGTLVDLRLRGGAVCAATVSCGWRWSRKGWDGDIVAYRVSKPAEPTKPDTSAEDALWHGYAQAAMSGMFADPDFNHPVANAAMLIADMADAMLAEAKKRGRV